MGARTHDSAAPGSGGQAVFLTALVSHFSPFVNQWMRIFFAFSSTYIEKANLREILGETSKIEIKQPIGPSARNRKDFPMVFSPIRSPRGSMGVRLFCFHRYDLSGGLPAFNVVGLPDAAVNEARAWARRPPKTAASPSRWGRITVNLAPAHEKSPALSHDLPHFGGNPVRRRPRLCGTGTAPLWGGSPFQGSCGPALGCCLWPLQAKSVRHPRPLRPEDNAAEATLAVVLPSTPVQGCGPAGTPPVRRGAIIPPVVPLPESGTATPTSPR